MDLNAVVAELVKTALHDHLEIDIYCHNDKLSVELYYAGDLITEHDMDVKDIIGYE